MAKCAKSRDGGRLEFGPDGMPPGGSKSMPRHAVYFHEQYRNSGMIGHEKFLTGRTFFVAGTELLCDD